MLHQSMLYSGPEYPKPTSLWPSVSAGGVALLEFGVPSLCSASLASPATRRPGPFSEGSHWAIPGALMIRIRFCDPFYYSYNKEPPK